MNGFVCMEFRLNLTQAKYKYDIFKEVFILTSCKAPLKNGNENTVANTGIWSHQTTVSKRGDQCSNFQCIEDL